MVSSMVRTSSGSGSNGGQSATQAALAANEATNGYPAVESALQPSTPYGALIPTTDGHHFIGESHWEAVLRDVCSEVRTGQIPLVSPIDTCRLLPYESPSRKARSMLELLQRVNRIRLLCSVECQDL